ncbi:hypothetical protein DB32_007241 [Sandaracinus amylolyticus]|uniref:Uncharacterized protein n=1 Tax=Sandaracinus amylolyticus TaxID=927083 RepID=A0A0F6W8H3_9BACT|nr:hypothetical protein DB32_007241 [Sandaracinus amylolyticus]
MAVILRCLDRAASSAASYASIREGPGWESWTSFVVVCAR